MYSGRRAEPMFLPAARSRPIPSRGEDSAGWITNDETRSGRRAQWTLPELATCGRELQPSGWPPCCPDTSSHWRNPVLSSFVTTSNAALLRSCPALRPRYAGTRTRAASGA